MNKNQLNDAELKIFLTGHCPDCGGGLLEGPSGGMCTNYMCDGISPSSHGDVRPESQRSKFNFMGMFGVDRIGASQCPKLLVTQSPIKESFLKRMTKMLFKQ